MNENYYVIELKNNSYWKLGLINLSTSLDNSSKFHKSELSLAKIISQHLNGNLLEVKKSIILSINPAF